MPLVRTVKRTLSRLFKIESDQDDGFPPPPKSYAESPDECIAKTPAESTSKTPVESPAECIAETPAASTAKTPAESPAELYLELTTKCMEQADMMTSFRSSSSPKFNHDQCKYLSYKLKITVQNAHSFFEQIKISYLTLASPEDMVRSLEIFKLLLLLSKEVECFIQNCCKDEWVQSAILLTNGLEHVISICIKLELCTIVFSMRKNLGSTPSLTLTEVASVRLTEAEIVTKMADIDARRLCEDLIHLIQSNISRIAVTQLATFLLETLNSTSLHPGSNSSGSFQSLTHPDIMVSKKNPKKLGNGASGTVHKAMWLGVEVAKKTFHGPKNPEFVQEVSILAGLCHPNIIHMFGYMIDEHKCQIIMELMDGDLNSLMQERLEDFEPHQPPFAIQEVVDIMLQVAEAVRFLHEKRIVHRDLKSHNILVRRGKATNVDVDIEYMQVKVADFGLSRTKERSMTYSNQTPNIGTTRWMAPEIMKLRNDASQAQLLGDEVLMKYPFQSDVYSFGMVCYEILTGLLPFSTLNPNDVKKVVLDGGRPQIPSQCPTRLRTLIEACWSSEITTRPAFGDICVELRQMKCEHIMTSAWANVPRCFSFDEIRRMTNGFSNEQQGFLKVYKGVIVDTGEVVAVERGYIDNWVHQMKVLAGLNHNNIVGRCVGFCSVKNEQILVYKGMSNVGTLGDWLEDGVVKDVNHNWPARKKFCLGVANGIHYLHAVCVPKVIHRDICPRNILLDANLEPKITGFRRALLHPDWCSKEFIQGATDTCRGEYNAPECGSGQLLSEKVDVYSYGVVLLDIVRGTRAAGKDCLHRELAWKWHFKGKYKEIIDPRLLLQPNQEGEALRMIKIALLCLHMVPERRPDMSLVVAMLQGKQDAKISSLLLEHERELMSGY